MSNPPNTLNILHWNCNGIKNKTQELYALITKTRADIILLNETKLNPSNKLKFNNYLTYRTDNPARKGKPSFGGTAVVVHRRIVHRAVQVDTTIKSTSIEIALGNDLLRVSAIYKPPGKTLEVSDLRKLTGGCDWFVVAGDLNAKHPLWHSRCVNPAGTTLYNHATINDYSVVAPDTPTHFPTFPGHRPDVLDVALVKVPNQHITATSLNELSSDHNPVYLQITDSPIAISPPEPRHRINWKKYTAILKNSVKPHTLTVDTTQNIDRSITQLTTNIQSAVDASKFPIDHRKFYRDRLPPEITLEIEEKNRLRREWQRYRDPATKHRLNNKIKFIRNILKTHHQDEWDKFLYSLDPQDGSVHKINRKLLHKRPATHPLTGQNGQAFTAVDRAELFADTFVEQFSPNHGPAIPEVAISIRKINEETLSPREYTTPGTVEYLIKHLNCRKAPGADGITNTALKFAPKNVILAILRIFNGCLRLGYFPDQWKQAIIITLPKSGKDHNLPANYRPIALLSCLSKLLEKIILQKLKSATDHQIRPEQYAFRKEHSTVLQLVHLTDHLCTNANNNEVTAAVFLDVEKAFDKVWHDGLLHKLLLLDTPMHIVKIIQSFLKNRYFQIKTENVISSSRPILAGVPQGSCLSPTLYSIYTNDIAVTPKTRVSLFADDTMFTAHDRNAKRAIIRIQHQINSATTWFSKWRLKINTVKTMAILFNKRQTKSSPKLTILGHQIPWSTSVKYLGVTLDRNLSFRQHMQKTVIKATRTRGMLYPILNRKSPIPLKTKLQIYKTYIKPIITYAGPAWGSLIAPSYWSRLESTQNICLRTITAAQPYVSNLNIRQSSKLTTIRDQVKYDTQKTFYNTEKATFPHIRLLGRSEEHTIKHNKIRPYDWSKP